MLRKYKALLRPRDYLPEPSQLASHAFDRPASRLNSEGRTIPPSDTTPWPGKSSTCKLRGADLAEERPICYVGHDDYEFLEPPTGSFGSVPVAPKPEANTLLDLHLESHVDLDSPTSFSLHSLEIPIKVEEMESAEVAILKMANGQLALEEINVL